MNTEWKGDSQCTIWGYQPHGGYPDELRRGSTGCDGQWIVTTDSSYTYQITITEEMLRHAEFLLRRGDTEQYENIAQDGSGSILAAIKFIIDNPVNPAQSLDWDSSKKGVLYVAHRYYRDSDIFNRLYTNESGGFGSSAIPWGKLTHAFTTGEDPGLPPTAIPPGESVVPSPTNTPVPAPSDTPVPTVTDIPGATNTPVPTVTDTPVATNTPIPAPTDTPVPSVTPSIPPTVTPSPTIQPNQDLSTAIETELNVTGFENRNTLFPITVAGTYQSEVLGFTLRKLSGPGTLTFSSLTASGLGVIFDQPGTYEMQFQTRDETSQISRAVTVTIEEETLAPPTAPFSTAARVPLYGFYHKKNQTYFYTISQQEKERAESDQDTFSPLGIVGYVSRLPGPQLRPVYRFFNTRRGYHFYSITEAEKDTINNTLPQFRFEGIAFYAALPNSAGSSACSYRFYIPRDTRHIIVTSIQRANILERTAGAEFEGNAWACIPEQNE